MSSPNCSIVVVGSLHFDIMIEAPDRPRKGETVIGKRWFSKFGGKGGNQAIAASMAGGETRFVGAVGQDGMASFMLKNLRMGGLGTEYVSSSSSFKTGISTAIVDAEGDYGAVIVSGANADIDCSQFDDDALWQDTRILVLQNEIPEAINLHAAKVARKRKITVCLNAAPFRQLSEEFTGLIDVLVVNAVEAEDMCSVKVENLQSAQQAAVRLTQIVPTAIVTAGGDGVALASVDGTRFALVAKRVELVSTHGAGDVFVGTLAASLAEGAGYKAAVNSANDAAALHVSKQIGAVSEDCLHIFE